MTMQVRVRALDGAELALDVPLHSVKVGVAEIKRLSLMQLLAMRQSEEAGDAGEDAEEKKDMEEMEVEKHTWAGGDEAITRASRTEATLESAMASACLVFRGQILADADDVNLFALAPADFFVLVEEDDGQGEGRGDDEEMEQETKQNRDAEDERCTTKKRRMEAKEPADDDHASLLQLVEMGFELDQARNAMRSARGEMARAVALLMGDIGASSLDGTSAGGNRLRDFVTQIIAKHPELAAIESLLMNEQAHILKKKARSSHLDALVLLKESFPVHWLAQMNENPAETLLFLALPEEFETRDVSKKETKRSSTASRATIRSSEIDLTNEDAVPHINGHTNGHDQEAIDRLTAMGFPSDLVVAMYESCGGNEEMTVNMLLETLQ